MRNSTAKTCIEASLVRNFISEAWELAKRKHQETKDLKERAQIAKVFNNRYTYCKEYVPNLERLPGTAMYGINPKGGFAWMCPECNKIHHPIESSVFSGLQYPACCKTPHGHRLYDDIKTD